MFTGQTFQMHQLYPGKDTVTESRCPQCGMLIAAATEDKYPAVAETFHQCRSISAPHLTQDDLRRLH